MAIAQPQQKSGRSGMPYTILGGVLAVIGFGAVLVFMNLGGGHSNSAGATGPQVDVLVASQDIGIRTPVTASLVTVQKFAAADAPAGLYYAKVGDAKNLVAAVDIKKGQPLSPNLLVKSGDTVSGPQTGYLPIPSGYVATTLPTGEQQGVAGYIQNGDYISIVVFLQGGTAGTNVRTLFTNVHVLKVGPSSGEVVGAAGASGPVRTGGVSSSLTVVVTQCQAEYLNWFVANATLKYTLESYHDYKPQDVAVDSTCPSVSAATGVTRANVAQRWPGIFG
jgi:Flp pilus assembly protein CpaB